jgi:predicted amidohydrolase
MPNGSISSSPDNVGVAVINYEVPICETKEDVLKNCQKIADTIKGAKRGYPGLDLIIFPEYTTQGFHPDKWSDLTTTLDGEEVEIFKKACVDNQVYGIFSITGEAHPEGKNPYNTLIMVSDKGEVVLEYRKVFPWTPKEPWTAGHETAVAEVRGGSTVTAPLPSTTLALHASLRPPHPSHPCVCRSSLSTHLVSTPLTVRASCSSSAPALPHYGPPTPASARPCAAAAAPPPSSPATHHPARACVQGPKGLIIGGLICYDANMPEIVRDTVMKGAELVVRIQGYMYPSKEQQRMVAQVRCCRCCCCCCRCPRTTHSCLETMAQQGSSMHLH